MPNPHELGTSSLQKFTLSNDRPEVANHNSQMDIPSRRTPSAHSLSAKYSYQNVLPGPESSLGEGISTTISTTSSASACVGEAAARQGDATYYTDTGLGACSNPISQDTIALPASFYDAIAIPTTIRTVGDQEGFKISTMV